MKRKEPVSRRTVLKWSIRLAAFYPVAGGLYSCQSDSKTARTKDKQFGKEKTSVDNKPADTLYYNPKSKVLHYPGIRAKQKTDLKNFQKIPIDQWEKYLNEGAKFPKETSGMAFEKLALRNYRNSANGDGIKKSLSITEKAFGKEYANQNRFNWRIYDLLLQWIALDESITATEKGNRFNTTVQTVDLSSLKFPRRMNWMKAKETIDQRAAYISQQKNKYIERLQKRMI